MLFVSVYPFRCLLLDADGVLQSIPDGWLDTLRAMAPSEPEGFLQAVLAAEDPATRGEMTFRQALTPVLAHYPCLVDIDSVMQVWRRLDIDAAMMDEVAQLRGSGLLCALATNQHDVRAGLMRQLPEYVTAFDAQFYSCEMGLTKPSPDFFRAIVADLGVDPAEALFLDDRADNVDGARSAGLRAEVFTGGGGRRELRRILQRFETRSATT